MNDIFLSGNINISKRKRRSKIALGIRLTIFLGITVFYLIYNFYSAEYKNDNVNPEENHLYSGRKLFNFLNIENDNIEVNQQLLNITKSENLSSLIENFNRHTKENLSSRFEENNGSIIPTNKEEENCTHPAIEELPGDGFTREQRQQGWILVHVIFACYCFWLLAIICDDYFVPAIELMCYSFNMKEDIVGATFMAAATSSPELFINCVGTFVTKCDIGVGTIVGSAVFNILAVPACCGLFAGQVIALDWWPISRDCFMYCLAVLGLIATLYDGVVMWYEALALVLAYFFYITAMYWNDKLAVKARKIISKFRRRKKTKVRPYREVVEITPLLSAHSNLSKSTNFLKNTESGLTDNNNKECQQMYTIDGDKATSIRINSMDTISSDNSSDMSEFADDPWTRGGMSWILFLIKWPITFVLWATIPDCRKRPRLRLLTFFISICWIGTTSYLVAFFITVVGDTLNVPDSVMGLTVLAAGMSVPEAVSSVLVTNQGHGQMGISNSIGSNTFDILLCLGIPWFVKGYFLPSNPGELWVELNSSGLTYSTITLLTTLFGLYIAFAVNKFRLDCKIGMACAVMYFTFLILATMIELNIFFPVNLPICGR